MKFHKIYDGGNKYIDYFSRALAEAGMDVTIVTTRFGDSKIKERKAGKVKYVFISPNISKMKILKLNSPQNLLFSRNLKKYLERKDFDILHSFGMFAFSYLHKSKRKPVITQPWGLEPFYGEDSLSKKGLKKTYVKHLIQKPWLYCLKKSDRIASEGDFQNEDIKRLGIDEKKIFPIPIGIDLEKIKKFKRNYSDKRREIGFDKNDFVILSVNQIAPDKGIEDLINAFYLIKKEIKHSKLIVVGAGILEREMHKMIHELGLKDSVVHLKNIPEKELYDCYFSSDVFVSAATQKDWIMGIQEAMACGLPVVSSAQPFLVEDGKNGFVVGMKNPKGIKEGVLKVCNGNRKKMSKESLKLSKKYLWKNIAKDAIKAYKRLIS